MKKENHIKESIQKILSRHPEGLSILEIANLVGVHRHTVNKYIHELIGAKVIYQRDLGTVKLHYLSDYYSGAPSRKLILEKIKRQIK